MPTSLSIVKQQSEIIESIYRQVLGGQLSQPVTKAESPAVCVFVDGKLDPCVR